MINPVLAPVRPRVISPESGEPLLLEDEIRSRLERGDLRPIRLYGPPGSGKSTALAHLAAVFSDQPRLLLHDEADGVEPPFFEWAAASGELIVNARCPNVVPPGMIALCLADWSTDELIEYLLAVHRPQCAAVMARVRSAKDADELRGLPELWRAVLDRMAEDDSPDINSALRLHLDRMLPNGALRDRAEHWSLSTLAGRLIPPGLRLEGQVQKLLRHRSFQNLLASDRLLTLLRREEAYPFLEQRLPRTLIEATAERIRANHAVVQSLERMLNRKPRTLHAMAASLLHAAQSGWKPRAGRAPLLTGAYLAGANWSGIQLRRLDASGADLCGVDLRESKLKDAFLLNSRLVNAQLRGSLLDSFAAMGANLSGADLSFARTSNADFRRADLRSANLEGALLTSACFAGANLTAARFCRANLYRADLTVTNIVGADFTAATLRQANLSGLRLCQADFAAADFASAKMEKCDLESMHLPGARFEDAYLANALFTDSCMNDAWFQNANLRGAGLAGINWERADLRNADLRGATFHLGSSRSGLVFSPYACEGSRTGFYTDEFNEQEFKSPEEIRKANLCGADLRGASLKDVDFYLVDLRGARYTPDQEQHFRRCGAILETRV